MASSLTTLCTDDIGTSVKSFLDVLGVSNHADWIITVCLDDVAKKWDECLLHIGNTSLVELLNDSFWWDTDSADKKLCLALDNDIG